MFTRKRWQPPVMPKASNETHVLIKAIQDYFLSLEAPGALTISEAEITDSSLPDVVNVKDPRFKAKGDGVADDTAAIQAAIDAAVAGQRITFPAGDYKITASLTTDDTIPVILSGAGKETRIFKAFDGDMVVLGKGSVLEALYLDGEGATWDGRGVYINTGALTDLASARYIRGCWILDTESYCVEFGSENKGYASLISGCQLVPTGATTAAVKISGTGETNGNRTLQNCFTGSNPIIDFGAVENCLIIGCGGGVPTFSTSSIKCTVVACRLVSTSGWTIAGNYHTLTGNLITTDAITFDSSCTGVKFRGNVLNASVGSPTVTDNAPGVSEDNDIDLPYTLYTPTWSASGSAPAIGDGVLSGTYERRGKYCKVQISFTAGSTTTYGTGNYRFSLPYTSAFTTMGSMSIFDSSPVALYQGVARVESGASLLRGVAGGVTADYAGATAPITFASGDTYVLSIEYPIT